MTERRTPARRRTVAPSFEDPPLVDVRLDERVAGGTASLLTIGFFIAAFLFIIALCGWIISSRDTGTAYLRSALASVTEIDRLVLDGLPEARQLAEAEPDQTVRLPGYPIAVDLEASFVLEATPDEIRKAALEASAERVYEDGADAFLAEGATAPGAGTLSATGVVRRALTIVGDDDHSRLTIAVVLLGLATMGLAAGLFMVADDPVSAAIAVCATTAAAGVLAIVALLLVRGLIELLLDTQDELVTVQLLTLARSVSSVALRTAFVIVIAAGVAAAAAAFARSSLAAADTESP